MDRAGREGGEALYAKRKHCGTLKELLTIIGLALLLAGLPLLGLLAWDSMRSAP